MQETLEAPAKVENQTKEIDTNTDAGLAEMLLNGVKNLDKQREERQKASADKETVNTAENKSEVQLPANGEAKTEAVVETPEQKQIKELTSQKETIQNDLKLSEIEKTAALQKLEGTKEKNFWEEPEFDSAPAPAAEKKENHEETIQLLAAKAKRLEEIENDEFYKTYRSAKESGKDVPTFLSEIGKNNPAGLSDEQVLEKSIVRSGLTEEEAAEQRDHFKTMSPILRKETIAKERAALNQDYQKNFEKYSTNNNAEREKTLSVAKQAIKESGDYLANIQGKEVRGIVYDSTQTQKLGEWAKNIMENGLFKEDGSWDVPTIMQLGMLKLNSAHMLQKAFEKGQYTSDEKWHALYGRPSKNNGIAKAPEAKLVNVTQEERKQQDEQWRKSL